VREIESWEVRDRWEKSERDRASGGKRQGSWRVRKIESLTSVQRPFFTSAGKLIKMNLQLQDLPGCLIAPGPACLSNSFSTCLPV
jgi:hypothetical protein